MSLYEAFLVGISLGLLFVLFRLGKSVGELKAQLGQMHQNLYFIEGRLMSALTDLQGAVGAIPPAIDALAARVAAIPTGTPDSELVPLTAALVDAKAKLDAVAVPA